MPAIEFHAVSKHFGRKSALEALSFTAEAGRVLGLLGPNGSGKTTALRLMLNLFYPDAGSVRVLGAAPSRATSDRVGYLPEERGLYRAMRVVDVLQYYAQLKGAQPSQALVQGWLERLGIAEYAGQRVQQLSKGTAQKVQFIATLLHDPQLVILDEPFSGLDPVSRVQMRQALQEVLRLGKTVLISTHDMVEAENLCDAYLMLSRGRKVLDATREQVRAQFGEPAIRLRLGEHVPVDSLRLSGVQRALPQGDELLLQLTADADPQLILRQLLERAGVEHFELVRPSLHDIFIRLAGAAESRP